MRKWTYLVAALLMGGATATFTSCIDTDEPAGITELRGAKAQLLLAKAKVQEAEVLIKTAQANLIQAKADYKQQMVEQQKLLNALQAEINAYKQDSIQREMKINEHKMNEKLYEAQQNAAQAQADYEKALADIEVALIGYKDNLIATELNDLLTTTTYTTTYKDHTTTPPTTQTVYMQGLRGVSATLRTANADLAEMMRELSKLKFTYDISSKIAATEGQLAKEKVTLEGLQKQLEDYETIAGKPYEEWDEQYQVFKKESDDLNAQKDALEVAEEEALRPVVAAETENNNTITAKTEVAFTIPEAIQHDFYWVLWRSGVSAFDAWVIFNQDGEATYPDGVKALMTIGEKHSNLGSIVTYLENNYILTDEALEATKIDMNEKKTYNDLYWTATTGKYYVDLAAWKTALDTYKNLYATGKYFNTQLNVRQEAIDAYEELATLTGDELTAATTAFRTQLKNYLTERAKIDGFKIGKTATPETAIDPTVDADWTQWTALVATGYDAAFGLDIAGGSINNGGAFKAYMDAANTMGYSYSINPEYGRLTEYTYEMWEEDGYSTSVIGTSGTAYNAFVARNNYDLVETTVTNKTDWDKLYADVKALYDANQKAYDAYQLAVQEAAEARLKVEAEYDIKEAAIDVQLAGLTNIMNQIKSVLSSTGVSGSDYATILENLKNEISRLKYGTVTATGDDYVFTNAQGSIPQQQLVVASYEKLLAALNDGSYKPQEEALITQKEQEIEDQNTYIAALEAIYKAVSDKKDALMAALTGGDE